LYEPSLTVVENDNNSVLEPSFTTSLLALELAIVAAAAPLTSSLAVLIFDDSTALPCPSEPLAWIANVTSPGAHIVG